MVPLASRVMVSPASESHLIEAGDPASPASPRSFADWSTWEVAEHLDRLGMGHHVNAFLEADIDGDALVYLDADMLSDLGVSSVGQRLKLLRSIYDLKILEGLEPDGAEWWPPSAAIQATVQSSYIQSCHDRLGRLESELAFYREEVDSLQVLVHALGDRSIQQAITQSPSTDGLPAKAERRKLRVDTSRDEHRMSRSDFVTPVGETSRRMETPLDSSAMPTGLMVSTPSSDILTPGPTVDNTTIAKKVKDTLKVRNGEEDLVLKPSPLQRPALRPANRTARSSPDLRRGNETTTTSAPLVHSDGHRNNDSELSPSKRPPTTAKRSGTQDTCFKVLPAAIKKYSLKHPWTEYAMIVTWAGQKRVLSYDEKPRVVVHRLREQGETPSCLVQHLSELKSPLALAAARRSKMFRSYIDEAKDPSLPLQHLPTLMTEQALSPEIMNRLPPHAKYALALFPYCAEREEELDTEFGDCFSIVSQYDGFVEVIRIGEEKPSKTKTSRVPACTVLPIYTLPSPRADGTSTLDTNLIGGQFQILYAQIDRPSAATGEVAITKGEKVRVYAKASYWSFLVKESDRTFGWAPDWHLGTTGSEGQ